MPISKNKRKNGKKGGVVGSRKINAEIRVQKAKSAAEFVKFQAMYGV